MLTRTSVMTQLGSDGWGGGVVLQDSVHKMNWKRINCTPLPSVLGQAPGWFVLLNRGQDHC